MHGAPSVTYPVGRSRFAAALLLLAWLLGAASLALWSLRSWGPVWQVAAAAGLLVALGAASAWCWWCAAQGELAWSGESWTWTSGACAQAGEPQVALDVQRFLLLHWRGGKGGTWLWLERACLPGRWEDLRRAVYSRARPDALPAATLSAAKP